MELNPQIWIGALRQSHDRLANEVKKYDHAALTGPTACTVWSVAQVMSHLGSQAEIFSLLLQAGLTGAAAPSNDAFPPIWDAWNPRSPEQQAHDSIEVNESFVEGLEKLDEKSLGAFQVGAFGMEIDAVTLFRMRLSEHAMHSWDIAIASDPAAKVNSEAIGLIFDSVTESANRRGKPTGHSTSMRVKTQDPDRDLAFFTDGVRFETWSGQPTEGTLQISAEALARLIYGRFRDADVDSTTYEGKGGSLDELRATFPGS